MHNRISRPEEEELGGVGGEGAISEPIQLLLMRQAGRPSQDPDFAHHQYHLKLGWSPITRSRKEIPPPSTILQAK